MNTAFRVDTRRARVTALLAALVAVLLLGLLVGPVHADNGNGSSSGTGNVKDQNGGLVFGLGPANHVPKNQVVDGRAYLIYAADAGAFLYDRVALFNYRPTPLTVQVYATDALQSTDGGFGLLTGAQTPRDAGSWFHLIGVPKSGKVTIPAARGKKPYGVLYVRFKVTIPAKATPGDHVGGLVASLKSTSTNTTGAKITLDQRVALRAYFSLAGKVTPSVAIEDLKGSYTNTWDPLGRGDYRVSYYMHNLGNLRLKVAQDVTVHRCILRTWLCPAAAIVTHPATVAELLPGARVKVTEMFPHRFGLGRPAVTVALHLSAIDSAYLNLKVPDVSDTTSFWALPWLLILIIIGILLVIALIVWRFVHNRRKKAKERAIAASAPAPKHAAPSAESGAAQRRAGGSRLRRSQG
jgi:hypothetical protein